MWLEHCCANDMFCQQFIGPQSLVYPVGQYLRTEQQKTFRKHKKKQKKTKVKQTERDRVRESEHRGALACTHESKGDVVGGGLVFGVQLLSSAPSRSLMAMGISGCVLVSEFVFRQGETYRRRKKVENLHRQESPFQMDGPVLVSEILREVMAAIENQLQPDLSPPLNSGSLSAIVQTDLRLFLVKATDPKRCGRQKKRCLAYWRHQQLA